VTDYAALKAAGVPLLGYGAFITVVINFLIVAFMIFLLVRAPTRCFAAAPRLRRSGGSRIAARDPRRIEEAPPEV
jgi:large conductance mechanosensitive channel